MVRYYLVLLTSFLVTLTFISCTTDTSKNLLMPEKYFGTWAGAGNNIDTVTTVELYITSDSLIMKGLYSYYPDMGASGFHCHYSTTEFKLLHKNKHEFVFQESNTKEVYSFKFSDIRIEYNINTDRARKVFDLTTGYKSHSANYYETTVIILESFPRCNF